MAWSGDAALGDQCAPRPPTSPAAPLTQRAQPARSSVRAEPPTRATFPGRRRYRVMIVSGDVMNSSRVDVESVLQEGLPVLGYNGKYAPEDLHCPRRARLAGTRPRSIGRRVGQRGRRGGLRGLLCLAALGRLRRPPRHAAPPMDGRCGARRRRGGRVRQRHQRRWRALRACRRAPSRAHLARGPHADQPVAALDMVDRFISGRGWA